MSTVVTMRQLLEAGVHFGHQTKRGNPKMKKYIYTARNDIHVIDLQKTIRLINDAYQFVRDTVVGGGKVLFVGTKKQAQEAMRGEALRSGMPFVNQRWLGGTLTNFKTIRKSIRRLKHIQKMKEDGIFEKLPSKEQSSLNRELNRLDHYLGGISEMTDLPKAVFVVDTHKEDIAVREAVKLGVPIVGVVDTNCDPTGIKYPIPANDDAIRAIKLLASIMANAVVEGNQGLVGTAGEAASEEGIDVDLDELKQVVEEKIEIEKDFLGAETVPETAPGEDSPEEFVEVAEDAAPKEEVTDS